MRLLSGNFLVHWNLQPVQSWKNGDLHGCRLLVCLYLCMVFLLSDIAFLSYSATNLAQFSFSSSWYVYSYFIYYSSNFDTNNGIRKRGKEAQHQCDPMKWQDLEDGKFTFFLWYFLWLNPTKMRKFLYIYIYIYIYINVIKNIN